MSARLLIGDKLWRDIRLGVRTLRKGGAFTFAAAVTLALGIGGTTAAFTAIDALLLKRLPYPDPQELVSIQIPSGNRLGVSQRSSDLTYPLWQQIRQHPEFGAQMLRQVPGINPAVVALALQHHERLDGSGYPRGGKPRLLRNAGKRKQNQHAEDQAGRLHITSILHSFHSPDQRSSSGG